jgi:hypothetical protein
LHFAVRKIFFRRAGTSQLGSFPSIEENRSSAAVESSPLATNAGRPDPIISSNESPADAEIAPIPSWLWWNILSLDAPVVAVVWALLFARAGGVRLALGTFVVLALAVWLIYITDRLLDGWRVADTRTLRARHLFCRRHPTAILVTSGLGAASGAWLVTADLSAAELKAGLLVGGIVAAYMLGIHLGSNQGGARREGKTLSRLVPKEIFVGFLFAAGTALPVWSQRALTQGMLITWLLFGLLCALNCTAIEYWENNATEGILESSQRLRAKLGSRIGGLAAGLMLLAWVAQTLFRTNSTAVAAIASAALLISLLNLWRGRLSANALRVLADVALLIPAILALAVRR